MGDSLDAIFRPRSIAVIGASRNKEKLGWAVLHNLIANDFQGTIYPVNPKADSVHSVRAYPSVLDIPGPVDLAVLTVPWEHALQAVEECGKKGVKGLVVITAGFREIGGAGVEREAKLRELARSYGMRMVGPNCMGVINTAPEVSMDATFAYPPPLRGVVSFMSQSGALGSAILDQASTINVGFAKFVSLGNKADVSGNDLLAAWEDDPDTRIVLMYIENFGNPQNFARIARRLTRKKPVIAVKSGRTEAGTRATTSHTGSLGESDVAAEAVLAQTGVIRAYSMDELFDYAMAFSLQKPPKGKRVAVVTDAGGPAIMCTDALIALGMEMATFRPETIASMRAWAPDEATLTNPVDLIASRNPEDYRRALDAVLLDENVDAVIAIYVPPVPSAEVPVARAIWETARKHEKTVVCNFLARDQDSPGFQELVHNGTPSYLYPESAARALAAMHRYREYLERDEGKFREFPVDRPKAEAIVDAAKAKGLTRLPETDALALLEAYGFATAKTRLVPDLAAAESAAKEIGFPVVLKAVGKALVHKTEHSAVAVDLGSERDLRIAFEKMRERLGKAGVAVDGYLVQEFVSGGKETILGMNRDKVFGPLLAFGLGGVYVEYLKDVAFGVAPITDADAGRIVRSIRTYPLLAGVRGEKPSDVAALQDALLRLSQLVQDFEEIQEVDLNPVIALAKGCKVVDARVIL